MNCENCGLEPTKGAKFCKGCGQPLTAVDATQDTVTKAKTISLEESIEVEKIKDYSMEFLNYVIKIIKKPVMEKQEARHGLCQKQVLIFLPIMMLINAFVVSLQFRIIQNGFNAAISSMWQLSQILGIGTVDLVKSSEIIKIQFVLMLIFFAVLALGIYLLYQLLFKMDITIIDVMRMALNTVIVLTAANAIGWILGLVSLKLLAASIVIIMVLFSIMIFSQLFKYIGFKAQVIYTIPVLYIISLYLAVNLYVKIF